MWMMFHSLVIILYIGFTKGSGTNQGYQFYLTVIEHIRFYSTCDLFIMTDSPSGASVKISVPLNPMLQPTVNVFVNPGESVNVSLNKNVLLDGFGLSKNGIFVDSDALIVVQVLSQSKSLSIGDTVGGYMAFPYHALGTQYMVVTYCAKYSCYIAMMATEDLTVVTLKFKSSVRIGDATYNPGDVKEINLNLYEAFQIKSLNDLTGILISSNHVISVFVGADGTTVVDNGEDYIIEQLPPVSALGTTHYLIPMPLRTRGDLVRVVAVQNETIFSLDDATYEMKVVGDHVDITISSTVLHLLNSSVPILVAQLCSSYTLFDTSYSDPNLVIVTPVRQWFGSYLFATPAMAKSNNEFHLALVALNECTTELKLDTQSFPGTWTPLLDTSYSMSSVPLTTEYHNISHGAGCQSIWGYIYGTALQQSWALPIGWGFFPRQKSDDETSTDLMSVIDEETKLVEVSSSSAQEMTNIMLTTSPVLETSKLLSTVLLHTSTSSLLDTIHSSYDHTSLASIPVSTLVVTDTSPINVDPVSTLLLTDTSPMNVDPVSNLLLTDTTTINVDITPSPSWTQSETPLSSMSSSSSICACNCLFTSNKILETRVSDARQKLTVNRESLGATIRKKISIPDHRISAQAMGSVAILFVVMVLALAVISDLIRALRFCFCIRAKDTG